MRGIRQNRPGLAGRAGGSTQRRPRAAALLAGGAAAATLTTVLAGAASASTPSWRIVKTIHGRNLEGITAVAASAPGHAWAFESGPGKPSEWRLTGSTWAPVTFPGRSGDMVTAAGASSAGNVWAFTAQVSGASQALRWNGHAWKPVRTFRQAVGSALVLGPANVWVFGQPTAPGSGLGAWHYNGTSWRRFPRVAPLTGASALGAGNIWAVGGKTAAHWNGTGWSVTSLAGVLPRSTLFCHPSADYAVARSARDVWAVGAGNCQDERGPFYLLHFNGVRWRLVAQSARYGAPQGVAPDGSGGLWIPTVAGFPGQLAMLHYAGGALHQAAMPLPASRLTMDAIAHAPHSMVTFGGGASFPANNPGLNRAPVILRYGP